MSDLTPLIRQTERFAVPSIIKNWKYATKVMINNCGCPTQIDLLLDQDGLDCAPLLYVWLRGNSCEVKYCPSGELEITSPVILKRWVAETVLSVQEGYHLFETIIPLVTMAMAMQKNNVAIPNIYD